MTDPMQHNARRALLQNHPRLVLQQVLRTRLSLFTARCFQTLNPGTPFIGNWHLEAIAGHLEEVRLGRIKRLIINMPPRSGKSISASIAFTAFILGHDPTAKIITVSYGQKLSTSFQNGTRMILTSPWYAELFPDTRIDPRKNSEHELVLTKRGMRLATSVGGTLTGRGGDFLIIDDPLKPDDAYSETRRKEVNTWFSTTLLSRLDNKKEGAIVIVCQRLHVDDLVGYVTRHDEGDWTVLDLPAIAHANQVIPLEGGRVHQRKSGNLLHAEREDQAVLDELKRNLGADVFEAQYQQRPVPPGGNLFKTAWLSYYGELPRITSEGVIFQSWDTASKTSTENDWSVGTTWLCQDGHYYLIDCFRGKLTYPDLRAKMIELAREHKPRMIVIEDAGSGTGLIEELCREGLDAIGERPKESKLVRAQNQTPKFQSRRVLFPRHAPWLSELETELLAFPAARHDDQVDSIVQALAYDVPFGPDVIYITPGQL